MQRNSRKARDKHDFQMRIEFGGAPRQLNAIHLRHHNISEQQIKGCLLDFLKGAGAFAKGSHMVASLLQRLHEETAHVVIVFCQNDLCHGIRLHLIAPSLFVNHHYY